MSMGLDWISRNLAKIRSAILRLGRSKGGVPLENQKCLKCEHIRCIDLFRKETSLEGGELFVLTQELTQTTILPCLVASPLQACCRLWSGAHQTLGNDGVPPLLFLVWQCMYDLKASIFLAMTAHYRNATQLLRPVMENLLTALYFEDKLVRCGSEAEAREVLQEFAKWQEGYYTIPAHEVIEVFGDVKPMKKLMDFGFLLEWLLKRDVLLGKGKDRFQKLENALNKYLHPYFPYTDIGAEKCSLCPGVVTYDEDRYLQWLSIFQNVVGAIIQALDSFYPNAKETDDGKEALGILKSLEWAEREFKRKTMACPHFRNLIKEIPEVEELLKYEKIPIKRSKRTEGS